MSDLVGFLDLELLQLKLNYYVIDKKMCFACLI